MKIIIALVLLSFPLLVYADCSITGDPAGLVGYWKLDDDNQNGMILDCSGQSNDGVAFNFTDGYGLSTDVPTLSTGNIGSRSFDGIKSVVYISTNPLSLNGTVSLWINTLDAGSSYRGLVVKPGTLGLFLYNNAIGFWDWKSGTFKNSGVTLNDGAWHHIAFSFQSGVNGGTIIYVDGAPVLITPFSMTLQTGFLSIGGAGNNQFFQGLIDDVRIYQRILTSAEIVSLAKGGQEPPPPPPPPVTGGTTYVLTQDQLNVVKENVWIEAFKTVATLDDSYFIGFSTQPVSQIVPRWDLVNVDTVTGISCFTSTTTVKNESAVDRFKLKLIDTLLTDAWKDVTFPFDTFDSVEEAGKAASFKNK